MGFLPGDKIRVIQTQNGISTYYVNDNTSLIRQDIRGRYLTGNEEDSSEISGMWMDNDEIDFSKTKATILQYNGRCYLLMRRTPI